MSRLSRFKKAPPPTLKLPKKLGRFIDDSDDDDFKPPARLEIKPKSSLSVKSENVKLSQTKQSEVASSDGSFSEYFVIPKEEVKEEKAKTKAPKVPARPVREKVETVTSKKSTRKQGKESSKSQDEISPPPSLPPETEDNSEEVLDAVLCPFCWKKLADKLSGTTHIKSCAKDLPIEQIHEAMLLQERQIQERKQLGLDFPASYNGNKRTKKAPAQSTRGRAGGGGGRARKKNADEGGADQQLELALALSVSLHEELECRQQNENKFLIENGLDKEIGLVEISSSPASSSSTANSIKPSKSTSSQVIPTTTTTSRRRGKKLVLENLPLYTVSDSEKRNIIAERVTGILEKSMNEEKEDFFIRDDLPPGIVSIPKRLQSFHDQECTLWNRAQSSPGTKAEEFSVLELDLSRPIEVLEMSDIIKSSESDEALQPHYVEDVEDDVSPKNLERDSTNSTIKMEKENEVLNSVGVGERNAESEVVKQHKGSTQNLLKSSRDETKMSGPIISNSSNRRHGKSTTSAHSSSSTLNRTALNSLPPVVSDIARMLFDGVDCDIVLYGREEKPIKCHRFMLTARCPKILREIIVEERPNRTNRHIIPLTDYTHETVKAFVWYLYTGTVEPTKESLLPDLQEMGHTYGVTVADLNESESKEIKPVEKTRVHAVEAEVQTDATCTKDSFSNTSPTDCKYKRISIMENTPSSDQNNSKLTQELFATFCFENSPTPDSEQQKGVASPNMDNSIIDDNGNSTQSSVDLFEDVENSLKAAKEDSNTESDPKFQRPVELEISNCFNINDNLEAPWNDNHSSDEDEEYFNELCSPVTRNSQTSSEKKRSRSVSPSPSPSPLGDHSSLYSATQVANMLQSHQDGRNQGARKQANKKQKLDDSILDISDEMDVIESENENNYVIDKCDKTNSVKLKDKDKSPISPVSTVVSFNITPRTTNTSRLLKRSISTPNLTPISNHITNSHHSPFYNPQEQINHNDDYDPLENACDDSVFANIPDDVFSYPTTKPKSPVKSASQGKRGKKSVPAPSCYDALTPPSRTQRRRPLAKDDSSQLSNDDNSVTMNKTKNNKAKGKEKANPKLKLPKRLPSVQEESAISSQSYSSPVTTTVRAASSQKNPKSKPMTPMLNYSLIDTPILKQELKKFGVKPLPRSKAKVLLRHIYKETHK